MKLINQQLAHNQKTNMKQRIVISESERKLILKQHSKFANKVIFEQTTNYTIADIKKEINTNYGGKFTSNPYNNKFGPTTAGEIVRALDVVKSKGVQSTSSTTTASTTTSSTTTTPTTDTTTTQGTTTTTTPSSSTTTTTTTPTTTTTSNSGGKEDPASGD